MTPVSVKGMTEAVAAYLIAGEVGTAAPAPSGTVITYKRLPESPDRAVAVTVYDVDDSITLPSAEVMVQVRTRGARNSRTDVDVLADAIAALLDGKHRFDMGSIRVQRSRRVSFSPQGADGNGREERADNYALILLRD